MPESYYQQQQQPYQQYIEEYTSNPELVKKRIRIDSKEPEENGNFDQIFIKDIKHALLNGKIKQAFCNPVNFKTGKNFSCKSSMARDKRLTE